MAERTRTTAAARRYDTAIPGKTQSGSLRRPGRQRKAPIRDAAVLAAAGTQAEDGNTTHEIETTYRFEPDDLYLKPGDCVNVTTIHTIEPSAIGLEREFNTGVLMPNGTAIFRFDEPMAIPTVCGVHPLMVGVLVIEEPEEPPAVQ